MAHYAQVIDGVVTNVIVADQEFIDTMPNPSEWIQTSYNTQAGEHKAGGTPLRYNYAGIGYFYDKDADAFYAPKPPVDPENPDVDYVLDTSTYTWKVK